MEIKLGLTRPQSCCFTNNHTNKYKLRTQKHNCNSTYTNKHNYCYCKNCLKHNYLSYFFSVVNSIILNVSHIVSRVNSYFRDVYTSYKPKCFVTIVVNRLATRIINISKRINNTFTQSNKKPNICIYNYMHKLSKKQGVYA